MTYFPFPSLPDASLMIERPLKVTDTKIQHQEVPRPQKKHISRKEQREVCTHSASLELGDFKLGEPPGGRELMATTLLAWLNPHRSRQRIELCLAHGHVWSKWHWGAPTLPDRKFDCGDERHMCLLGHGHLCWESWLTTSSGANLELSRVYSSLPNYISNGGL